MSSQCVFCNTDEMIDSYLNHDESNNSCQEWFCARCLRELIKYYRCPMCPICDEDLTELIDFMSIYDESN